MIDRFKLKLSHFSLLILVTCLGSPAAPLNGSNLLDALPFAIEIELSIQGRFNSFEAEAREKHLRVVRDALEV